MKKKIMAAVMTAAMVAGLAGSTASVYAAEDTIILGFSQVGAESDWRTANTSAMK